MRDAKRIVGLFVALQLAGFVHSVATCPAFRPLPAFGVGLASVTVGAVVAVALVRAAQWLGGENA